MARTSFSPTTKILSLSYQRRLSDFNQYGKTDFAGDPCIQSGQKLATGRKVRAHRTLADQLLSNTSEEMAIKWWISWKIWGWIVIKLYTQVRAILLPMFPIYKNTRKSYKVMGRTRMQVINWKWLKIRQENDKQPSHVATRILLHANLWHNTINLQAPLIWCSGQDSCSRLKAMANAGQNSFSPSPLRCSCPPQAEDLNTCTVIGRRCWLLSCVDLGNNIHFTQTTRCVLNAT